MAGARRLRVRRVPERHSMTNPHDIHDEFFGPNLLFRAPQPPEPEAPAKHITDVERPSTANTPLDHMTPGSAIPERGPDFPHTWPVTGPFANNK